MADFQGIGKDSFTDAVFLYDETKYLSATSRFYYAAFAVLTFELTRRGAQEDFRNLRSTPSHSQIPDLIEKWFVHLGAERRRNLARCTLSLYKSRLSADYGEGRVDRDFARKAYRDAEAIFTYLETKR